MVAFSRIATISQYKSSISWLEWKVLTLVIFESMWKVEQHCIEIWIENVQLTVKRLVERNALCITLLQMDFRVNIWIGHDYIFAYDLFQLNVSEHCDTKLKSRCWQSNSISLKLMQDAFHFGGTISLGALLQHINTH